MEVLKIKQIMTNPLGDRDTIRGYLTLVIRGKGDLEKWSVSGWKAEGDRPFFNLLNQ